MQCMVQRNTRTLAPDTSAQMCDVKREKKSLGVSFTGKRVGISFSDSV